MKKLILLLTFLIILTALIACSAPQVVEPSSDEATEEAATSNPQTTEKEPDNIEDALAEMPEKEEEVAQQEQPKEEINQESSAQSDHQGFATVHTYDLDAYKEEFGKDKSGKEETASEKANVNSRLIPYNEEEFSFLEYRARPDLGHFTYCFQLVGIERGKCEIGYDYKAQWDTLEAQLIALDAEVITLDSAHIEKIIYDPGDEIDMYLTYIDGEPVLIRFFRTSKEDALEILEGCEFVAPEEITK